MFSFFVETFSKISTKSSNCIFPSNLGNDFFTKLFAFLSKSIVLYNFDNKVSFLSFSKLNSLSALRIVGLNRLNNSSLKGAFFLFVEIKILAISSATPFFNISSVGRNISDIIFANL